jgi:hypothetical protein
VSQAQIVQYLLSFVKLCLEMQIASSAQSQTGNLIQHEVKEKLLSQQFHDFFALLRKS